MAESHEINSSPIFEYTVEQVADFVEWYLANEGKNIYDILQGFEGPKSEILLMLADSASWSLKHLSERTRNDILLAASEAIFVHDEYQVLDALQSGDKDLAETSVRELFGKWPAQLAISYSPSPLFPDGRQEYLPLDLSDGKKPDVPLRTEYVVDCHGQKVEINKDIAEYVDRHRDREPIEVEVREMQLLAESFLSFDEHEYKRLREAYGTKAATLFIFDRAITAFHSAVENIHDVANFKVPKFTAASVELHKMFKNGDERYEDHLEEVRQQAISVTNDRYDPELYRPLVVIRSSAVLSEDGINASGAGIYASVPADPRDPVSFRQATETVFDSIDTDKARAYLKEKGIENEHMGLLIQRYIEDTKDYNETCAYGNVQSSDPFDRFISLSSKTGELLFDRAATEARFMIKPPYGLKQPTLHYNPDHTSLISYFSRKGAELANAALFAEKLFGRQVELEFALDDSNTAYIVQVRPLPNQEKPEVIKFPSDIEPFVECRAIGVGDVIVTVRDNGKYTGDEMTFDWVDNEQQTGDTLKARDEKTVFVIDYNDGESGHIQMLARERGQICLYPNALAVLPPGLSNELEADPQQNRVRTFRVVSDGYRGAIYPFDEERNKLLQSMADGIARYITFYNTEA